MSTLTFELPDELRKMLELIANEQSVTLETLIADTAADMADQYEISMRLRQRAERGRDLKDEALALLRKE